MKTILLTFDYELFMGDMSGTPQKCLIEPTGHILQCLGKYNCKATFFIDALYLWKLNKEGPQADFQLVSKQIIELISKGHRVELHMHPQWSQALYDNGHWKIPAHAPVAYAQMPKDQINMQFKHAMECLPAIAKQAEPSYKPIAYRAGGLFYHNFEKIREQLILHGLSVDSSIAPALYFNTAGMTYDLRGIRQSGPYYFENDPERKCTHGRFLEVPVTSYQNTFLDKLQDKLKRGNPYSTQMWGDGNAIQYQGKTPTLTSKLIQKLCPSRYLFSLDTVNLKNISKKIQQSNLKEITFISHPKLMSEQSIAAMDSLLQTPGLYFTTLHDLAAGYRQS